MRLVPCPPLPPQEKKYLLLSAPPRSLGIDVEDAETAHRRAPGAIASRER